MNASNVPQMSALYDRVASIVQTLGHTSEGDGGEEGFDLHFEEPAYNTQISTRGSRLSLHSFFAEELGVETGRTSAVAEFALLANHELLTASLAWDIDGGGMYPRLRTVAWGAGDLSIETLEMLIHSHVESFAIFLPLVEGVASGEIEPEDAVAAFSSALARSQIDSTTLAAFGTASANP
jgi:hypothetical protein